MINNKILASLSIYFLQIFSYFKKSISRCRSFIIQMWKIRRGKAELPNYPPIIEGWVISQQFFLRFRTFQNLICPVVYNHNFF